MTSKQNNRFGGAKDAVLEQVANAAGSSISIADIGSTEAFIDGWIAALSGYAKHLISQNGELKAPVCITYVSDVGEFGREYSWQRRSTLGTSSQEDIQGVLAVATGPFGAYVYPHKLSDVGEIEEQITNSGLQDRPTLILTSVTRLLIWPRGLGSDTQPIQCQLDDTATSIDLGAIDHQLTRFYEVVARQTTGWWKKATERITVKSPETTVQDDLWIFLAGIYADIARVKKEYGSGNGRTDITILPSRVGHSDQSAVLELKTIRDVRTPEKETTKPTKIPKSKNIEWACSGVQQTAAYRDHEKLDGAFLCVYDFCQSIGQEVMRAVEPHAIKYDVLARHYWITSSHEEHRDDRYPLTDKTSV